ncbi:hypothetical protein [Nocardioides sp. SYSU DS0651]|uniref:hypothetical protein n=1 Tax=Nocardioides sp. SYSU DS0651 TaxID=3415955 RepID=UPI003F4C56A6
MTQPGREGRDRRELSPAARWVSIAVVAIGLLLIGVRIADTDRSTYDYVITIFWAVLVALHAHRLWTHRR